MKIQLDYFSCIFSQTLEATRMATNNEKIIREVLNEYAWLIPEINPDAKTPGSTAEIQEMIKHKIDNPDPNNSFKKQNKTMVRKH